MNRKTFFTIIIALLFVIFIAFLWWWFLGRASTSLAPNGGFGTASNKNLSGLLGKSQTNLSTPTVEGLGELPNGTYVFKLPNGTSLGSYTLQRQPSGTYTIDGRPLPTGTYVLYNQSGTPLGAYTVSAGLQPPNSYTFSLNPPILQGQYTLSNQSGKNLGTFTLGPGVAPNVPPGIYVVGTLDGGTIGTYVVDLNIGGGIYVGSPTDPSSPTVATSTPYLGVTNTPDVYWYFSTTTTISFGSTTQNTGGGVFDTSPGTIFNPTDINQIAGSNPAGGLAPNFDEGTIGSVDKGGLGLGGALAGAAVGAAVACALPYAAGYVASAVGLGASTAFGVAGGASTVAGAGVAGGSAALSAAFSASPAAGGAIAAATGAAAPVAAGSSFVAGDAAAIAAAGDGAAGTATGASGGGSAAGLASVFVIDIPMVIGQIFQGLTLSSILAVNTSNTALHVSDQSKSVLDCIWRTAGKAVVRVMTNSLVNWINSGFKGTPSFVTNPTQFFTNVADIAAGQFIKGSGLAFLCSPFKLQVKIAIAYSYAHQGQECTLTGILGNINNFINGSFNAGGWPTFLSFTMSANNNPFGAYAYGVNGLNAAVSQAQGNLQVQLNQGRGFLSLQQKKDCKTQSSPPVGANPNQFVQSIGAGNTVDSRGNVTSGGIVVTGGTGSANKQSVTPILGNAGQQGPTQSGATLDSTATAYAVCDLVTTTPGSIIAGTLQKALDTSTDSLNLAQSFDQVIAALIQQLMNAAQQGISNFHASDGTVGGAYYTADQQAAQSTGQGLIGKMQTETGIYQQIGAVVQGEIGDIQGVQSQLNTLNDCWKAAVTKAQRVVDALRPPNNQYADGGGPLFLNINTAPSPEMVAFSAASTTAHQNLSLAQARVQAVANTNAQYEAKIALLNNQITNINGGIAQLEQFQSTALSVGSSDEAVALSANYLNAQVHATPADLTTQQQNRTSLQTQLASDAANITTSLNQCHAF